MEKGLLSRGILIYDSLLSESHGSAPKTGDTDTFRKRTPVSAYVIVDVEVKDLEKYQEYRKLAPATVQAHGGTYLARGNKIEYWEGNWTPKYIALVKFESFERAKAWYESPEYSSIRPIRRENTHSKMILVDGIS